MAVSVGLLTINDSVCARHKTDSFILFFVSSIFIAVYCLTYMLLVERRAFIHYTTVPLHYSKTCLTRT